MMHFIDWVLVAMPILVVAAVSLYARRYLKSVADFMAGGRLGGRYLLATSRSEMGAGAIGYVSTFEWFSNGGFTVTWWGQLAAPLGLILAISGFVIYRYRQTRALTLAQFFEMRYSRRFRLFTGVLAFCAGLLNFGVIPVVGSKFMMHFLDLPQYLPLGIPTYLLLMGCFLTFTVLIAITGGQITIMLADCIQGMFSQLFYVIIGIALVVAFSWPKTREMLLANPPGRSLVNPFDSFGIKDFNVWFVLINLSMRVYTVMAWQNNQGFNSAAASPHESRMGYILGSWRAFALSTAMLVLAITSMTYLHSPEGAARVNGLLTHIRDPQTAEQMRLPIGLAQVLPIGIKGLFLSVVLMGIFGGDGQHLHSWGSIFVQDIVLPLRRHPLSTRAHIILLRSSIIGVALFAFCFGAIFTQTEYLAMWFNITMAVYVGGAGACIIGGLYWDRGTTAGAWTGLLTGSILSLGGILVRQPSSALAFQKLAGLAGLEAAPFARYISRHLGDQFPLNGTELSFYACLLALGSYIIVSLLTCRTRHDMDRLLHRGKYAVEPSASGEPIAGKTAKAGFHLHKLIGIDEHFTRADRWVTIGITGWSLFWFAVFVIGSIVYLLHPWSAIIWADYWLFTAIYLPLVLSVVTTIWFTIGCSQDLSRFIRGLRTERVDAGDDGTVE